MLMASGNPPPSNHKRKNKDSKPEPGHEQCQHVWRIIREEAPTIMRGSNTYHFGCYCLVTRRFMKTRVPVFYFWFGDLAAGRPEVQYGDLTLDRDIILR